MSNLGTTKVVGLNGKDATMYTSKQEEEDEARVLEEVIQRMGGLYLDRTSRELLKTIPGKDDGIDKVQEWALEVAESRTVQENLDMDKILWRGSDLYNNLADNTYYIGNCGLFDHQDRLSPDVRRLLTSDVVRLVRIKKALENSLAERQQQQQQQQRKLDCNKKLDREVYSNDLNGQRSSSSSSSSSSSQQQQQQQPIAIIRFLREWKEAWNEGGCEDKFLLAAFTVLALGILIAALYCVLKFLLSQLQK